MDREFKGRVEFVSKKNYNILSKNAFLNFSEFGSLFNIKSNIIEYITKGTIKNV
jgi:hypothetical protein